MDELNLRKRQARFLSTMRMRRFRTLKRRRRNINEVFSSSSSSDENLQEIRENANDGESESSLRSISAEANIEENRLIPSGNVANEGHESAISLNSTSSEASIQENHLFPLENVTTPNESDSSVSAADPSDIEDLMGPVNFNEENNESEVASSIYSEWSEESAVSNILEVQEIEELRNWVVETNQCHEHVNRLLLILRRRLLPELPKTAKTLLQTSSARYTIIEMEDANGDRGEFVYFTLKKGLERCVNPENYTSNVIELIINADGMSLTESVGKQMWVIAAKIHGDIDIYKPFPVAIFYGKSKPASADEYLNSFILETNDLLENGIDISGRHFEVRIKCFVCDTPARAFLKCTVGHTARFACERCVVLGRKVNKTTVCPKSNCQKRTDESFRTMNQRDHHHMPSPLIRINPPIDIIVSFILDFMHLCLLGVMKKLMEWWMAGDLNVRLGHRMKIELSRRLESIANCVPSEFQRKTRSAMCFARWKATEFRFMLLYCGPIVLKNILPTRLYKHFLLFHVACRILSCERLCLNNIQQAKQFLLVFFQALPGFYGPRSQILNFHHLIHMPDDVEAMQCSISRITAFPFESLLGKMRRKLHTASRPLAQLCRRLHEEYFVKNNKVVVPPEVEILKSTGDSHFQIKYKQFIISNKSPDNLVLLKNGEVFQVEEIRGPRQSLVMQGKIWKKKIPIFNYPCDSGLLNMWELQANSTEEMKNYSIESFDRKMIYLPVDVKMNRRVRNYAVPLLH